MGVITIAVQDGKLSASFIDPRRPGMDVREASEALLRVVRHLVGMGDEELISEVHDTVPMR